MDAYTQILTGLFELDLSRERTEEAWRKECNEKGLEIYYDMTDAVERGDDEDCGVLVGHYRTRSCPNHYEGHVCNPPKYGRITGLSVSPVELP